MGPPFNFSGRRARKLSGIGELRRQRQETEKIWRDRKTREGKALLAGLWQMREMKIRAGLLFAQQLREIFLNFRKISQTSEWRRM